MRRALLFAASAALCGCASMAQSNGPAVLTAPDAAVREELRATVSRALGRDDIVLAHDALTDTSVLLIAQQPARDATGQRLSGRDFGRPERFALLMDGGRCVLVHENTGARYELQSVRCAPAN